MREWNSVALPYGLTFAAVFGIAIPALFSSGVVLSRDMTWDLVYNLDGAWRIFNGLHLHTDFHDPLGALPFWLTALSFNVTGPSVFAVPLGTLFFAALVFVLAAVISVTRLPLLPSLLLATFCALIALVPFNIAGSITDFTYAMSYNRLGWSLLSVVCVALFIPRRAQGDGCDPEMCGLLLIALFHLKITYFAAGAGALCAAVVLNERLHRGRWLVVAGLVATYVFLPFNWPYLNDIWMSAEAGNVRKSMTLLAAKTLFDKGDLAFAIAGVLLFAHSAIKTRDFRPLLTVLYIIGAGLFALSQNEQAGGVPVFVVIALMMFLLLHQAVPSTPVLALVPLVLPCLWIVTFISSLFVHWHIASKLDALYVTQKTTLRGLAVPRSLDPAPAPMIGNVEDRVLGVRRYHEATQQEFVEATEEVETLFADYLRDKTCVVIDQVNPLTFALGLRPFRGGNLWQAQAPELSAEDLFGDADTVAIPKHPVCASCAKEMLNTYASYLAAHFVEARRSESWTILEAVRYGSLTERNGW